LGGWIGDFERYSTNQDLRGKEVQDVTTGSVADDLADIWKDLTVVLEADGRGTAWQEVAWQVRLGRAVGAITQLKYCARRTTSDPALGGSSPRSAHAARGKVGW